MSLFKSTMENVIESNSQKGTIPIPHLRMAIKYGNNYLIECEEWWFSEKYEFESRLTGQKLNDKVFKYIFYCQECTLYDLKSLPEFRHLTVQEQDELLRTLTTLDKIPTKIIVHRDL